VDVGLLLGILVCVTVGEVVGFLVGDIVGVPDTSVGAPDDESVGSTVG